MKKFFVHIVLLVTVAGLLLTGCRKEENTQFTAAVSIDVSPEVLDNISITLPENMIRETVSDIQHDFIQDGVQVGGIVVVDIPKKLLDSPREGKFEIAELLRTQIMPDISAEEAELTSWGGDQNAYMELITGPDELTYFHYLFRGVNNTYDVWFNGESIDQDTEMIEEIVNSVTGEDILPENNQSPF